MDMDLTEFAQFLGFENEVKLWEATEIVIEEEGDVDWYITKLPDGRWAAWNDGELTKDRVEFFSTWGEALRHQWDYFKYLFGYSCIRL